MSTLSTSTRRQPKAIALGVAFVLVLAGCSSTGTADVAAPADAETDVAAGSAFGPTEDELNTIAIAERFSPSTAALDVTVGGEQMLPRETDSTSTPIARSSGSGFQIDVGGASFVVTNFHVVQDTLEQGTSEMRSDATIVATFSDGGASEVSLNVVGVNPSFDLALLEATGGSTLPNVEPIPLGDSDLVLKGQKTIAIGNPFGLGATLTTGNVSSVGRFVQSIGEVSVPMIQTDAAINPGNSGGALLSSSGELIGVNTAIFNPEAAAFAGIGFAVPSNLLLEALANLELGGVSNLLDTRPGFGASLGSLEFLPADIREAAELPSTGVAVLDVAPGGPAEAAGLRVPEITNIQGLAVPVDPDVVIAIDGQPVESAEDLNLAITYEAQLGQVVELTILRGGEEVIVPVTLGS